MMADSAELSRHRGDVARFVHYLRDQRGLSENTVYAYANDIEQFIGFVTGRGITDWMLPQAAMAAYVEMLGSRGYAISSQSRKIASVRSLYRFLIENGLAENDPTAELRRSWRRRDPPDVLTTADIDRLIEAATAAPGEFAGQRDRAMIEVLYGTGAATSELVQLELVDVDLDAGTVRCGRGKRSDRLQPIGPRVVSALRHWIFGQRSRHSGEATTALFVNQRGKRLTRQGSWLILKRVARNSGIRKTISPRILRHTFATNLAAHSDSLAAVRARLGHVSGSASAMYQQLARDNERTGDRLQGS